MADSPSAQSGGPLRLTVTCAGQAQEAVSLISVHVQLALNRIPRAELVIVDGDMPAGKFAVSDGDAFAPGSAISISAGYGDAESPLFSGIVVRHGIRIGADNVSRLIVECRDKAAKMTLGRHNANYIDQKDSDVITTLIGKYGLTADVAATATQHRELVQYYCSDWDFVLARAEANGLLVHVADAQVSVQAPAVAAAAVLSVTWGSDLFACDADIDARDQWTSAQATAWDPKSQAVVSGDAAQHAPLNAQGNLDGATLAQVASPATFVLQTAAPQEQADLSGWARAAQVKAGLARIRGHMRFQGSAKAVPGCLVEIKGVGARFNGNVFVSGVEHRLENGDWTTEVEFGMAPDWHMARTDIAAPANGGLLPGVGGLQIGVVMKLDADPAGEQRIQVKVPVLQADTEGVWARLPQFYASSGFGAFFPPEVGDEVLLGYVNDDPCHPIVLGALYSSARAPAYALAAENDTKAIVTRCRHKIEFNEKDKIITLTTPGNNKIVLDDTGKSILVSDQNGNTAKLSEAGIALDSPKDIKLTAQGGITLTATGAITLKATQDVKASGLNIACEAQIGFTGKGSATAELSAAGQTTVKGALVMIN